MNPVGVTRADNLHGKFRNSVAEFFCVYRCVESLLSKAPEGTKRKLCRLCLHNFPCKIVCRDPVSGRAAPRAANPVGDRAPQRQQFFPLHRVMPDLNDFVVIADAVR